MFFDNPRTRKLLIGLLLIFCGIDLRIVLVAYAGDYSSAEITFYTIFGILMALVGLAVILHHIRGKRAHEMDFSEDHYSVKNALPGRNARTGDHFRRDMEEFFAEDRIEENMPVQADCTQIYNNILDLQKNRLSGKNIHLEWKSVPRAYTKKPFREKTYTDGKYVITECDQEIESRRRFSDGERTILLRSDKELAHYTILKAKTIGESQIICPNCGSVTTRENLLDGCDYCGTKFVVEDLGEKIAGFSLRDNADLAYAKYKDKRLDRCYSAFWIFFILASAFFAFCMIIVMLDEPGTASDDPMNPLFLTFSLAGISASFGYLMALVMMVGYMFVIFPITEILGNVRYHSKKGAEKLRLHEQEEQSLQNRIREQDPLFSLEGFYSNLQNKIASILFAENSGQINAFSETDLSIYLPKYRDVIDYDITEMNLEDYSLKDDFQQAQVNVTLQLFTYKDSEKKARQREEHMKIRVKKSRDSRTRAVCAPYIIPCPSCGSSLSLLNGMVCENCGTRQDLWMYDWVIESYEG